MGRPNGGRRSYGFHEKANWARGKMQEAVSNGDIAEAQKFNDIASAYDYRENQKSWGPRRR